MNSIVKFIQFAHDQYSTYSLIVTLYCIPVCPTGSTYKDFIKCRSRCCNTFWMTPAESLTRKDNFLPTEATAIVERQSRLDVVIFLASIERNLSRSNFNFRLFFLSIYYSFIRRVFPKQKSFRILLNVSGSMNFLVSFRVKSRNRFHEPIWSEL